MLEVFPLLPLIGKVSLGVGALSYAGGFNITAVADREAYPDLEIFAAGVREELAALEASAGVKAQDQEAAAPAVAAGAAGR